MLGLAEAAELLGLSRRALSGRRGSPDFPVPVAELRCGPVWEREQIVAYAASRSARFRERRGVRSLAERSSADSSPADGWLSVEGAALLLRVPEGELLAFVERRSPPVPTRRDRGRIVALDGQWLGWIGRRLAEEPVEHA